MVLKNPLHHGQVDAANVVKTCLGSWQVIVFNTDIIEEARDMCSAVVIYFCATSVSCQT